MHACQKHALCTITCVQVRVKWEREKKTCEMQCSSSSLHRYNKCSVLAFAMERFKGKHESVGAIVKVGNFSFGVCAYEL